MDISCSNLTKLIGNGIECKLFTTTQSSNDTVSIDYGNGNSDTFTSNGYVVSYFGISVTNQTVPKLSSSGSFLLTNSEFKFDTNLIGFNIFTSAAGPVTLSVNLFFV